MSDATTRPPFARTTEKDLPPEKAAALSETRRIVHAYLMGVWIVSASSARDPDFAKTHLLRYLVQDLIEAAVSVEILVFEGVHRVIKRELRFIIEASAKLASVQQANFGSTIEEKLADFDEQLKSHLRRQIGELALP